MIALKLGIVGGRLPVSVVRPLLDGLNVGVDNGCLLDGVGSGEVGPGWEDVGSGGNVANDPWAGDDVSDWETVGAEGGTGDTDDAGGVGTGHWHSSGVGNRGSSPLG